ncbi:hypothetical protein [Halomonas halodenitrificans]|uniref:hypothetical protein n=1 Tax=Halomonas halodenitrificans TaxID=28252 RepID=UPI000480A6EE|nr:hypothetical protein [Halomonas halodenitrificans]
MKKLMEAILLYRTPGIACLLLGVLFTTYISPNTQAGFLVLVIITTLGLLVVFKLVEWIYHVYKNRR